MCLSNYQIAYLGLDSQYVVLQGDIHPLIVGTGHVCINVKVIGILKDVHIRYVCAAVLGPLG